MGARRHLPSGDQPGLGRLPRKHPGLLLGPAGLSGPGPFLIRLSPALSPAFYLRRAKGRPPARSALAFASALYPVGCSGAGWEAGKSGAGKRIAVRGAVTSPMVGREATSGPGGKEFCTPGAPRTLTTLPGTHRTPPGTARPIPGTPGVPPSKLPRPSRTRLINRASAEHAKRGLEA